MVTQNGDNTHVFAIHGNFDQAQTGVKQLFEDKELEKFIVEKAKLWLDSGYIFGKEGEGFQRINISINC